MRYVGSATAAAIALIVLAPPVALGQNELKDLSIANYQSVSEQRVTRTQSYVTYRADLVNRGLAPVAATATASSLASTVEVVAGRGTLHFPTVPAGGQVTSVDTFTLLVDRSVPFEFASLSWSFLNPVANAGPNQTKQVGQTVNLNGSGSSNPSGAGPLTYGWAFTARPSASSAALSASSGVLTSFVVDIPGTYVVTLTVSNGPAADSTTVTISTVNSPPVASAGPNQTGAVGALVALNGSASSDVDGNPLTYLWSLITIPPGSSAQLSNTRTPSPTFVADKPGTYVAQLVVNDGTVNSNPATVAITVGNTLPVANAGPNQVVTAGTLVQLNGSGSTDVDGDPLTFKWSFNSVPTGSTASLSNPSAVNPTFTADRTGTYVVQLIVNDGTGDSQPSTVTVTNTIPQAPVANAGPNQTVVHGAIATLSGSGTDPQNLPLTFTWALITRPPNSLATLSSISAPHPTFVADQPGMYVAQLIVSNGFLSSQPATVTITDGGTPPVANAGPNQDVSLGVTVYLDGSASSDADNNPLTYSWSLISRPASSTAVLQGAVTRTPSFFADMAGTYVAQLIVNDGFANSSPSTVMITVRSAGAIGLPSNATVALGQSTQFPVILPSAAPQGGVTVTLTSDSTNVAISPRTVTIGAGQTQPSVQPQVYGNGPGTANITASSAAYTSTTTAVRVTATISITPPSISFPSRTPQILTLTLSGPAPSDGLSFALSSSNPILMVPATVTMAGGATTTKIAVVPMATGTAVIHVSAPWLPDFSLSVTITTSAADIIVPATLSVPPGESVVYPISLASPAASLVFLDLTSSDPTKATLSASTITIPAGQTVPRNQLRIIGLATGAPTIRVKSESGTLADATTAVTVGYSLSVLPSSLTIPGPGNTATLNLTLSGPAPAGGIVLTLTSSNPDVASVPPSVTLIATSTSVGARVLSVGVGTAVIHVSGPNVPEVTVPVTVTPSGSVSLSGPATIGLSQTATLTVSLSTPATGSGLSVDLTSSDPTKVTVSPSTVTIPAGSTTPINQPQLTAVDVGNVTISASSKAYTPPAPLAVAVYASVTWISPNKTVVCSIGNTVMLQLRLNGMAPRAGLTVNMTSSNPSVATVQAVSSFLWDGSPSPVILIPMTCTGFGTTIIHASGANIPDVTTTLTVSGPLAIATTALPQPVIGTAYRGPLAATGGTAPYAWSAAGLPADLSIDAGTGAITGTPTTEGLFTVNVTVTDSTTPAHLTASKAFTLMVDAPIAITLCPLVPVQLVLNSVYNGRLCATGGIAPYRWSVTGLPAGLMLDPNTGVITGTPTVAGTISISVTVTDSSTPPMSSSKAFALTIIAPLAIATNSLPSGIVGTAYNSGPLAATGGFAPYAWTATGLPAGLSIDPGTGAIAGTPTVAGPGSIVVTVTDSFSPTRLTASKMFALTIVAGVGITTASLPNGAVGTAYAATVAAAGGTPPYSWTARRLPAGLSLDPISGVIRGTPIAAGTQIVTITVTDGATPPQVISKTFQLDIDVIQSSTITVSSATVGGNMQTPITITFTPPLPIDETVTISSSNGSLAMLGGGALVGATTLQANLLAGTTSTNTFVEALGFSGQVTITASVPGYTNGTGTVTLANAGFVVGGPNGIGAAFTTFPGLTTALTVCAARLDSSGAFVEVEQLRGGFAVDVPIVVTGPALGTLSQTTVTISGGSDCGITNFTAGTGTGKVIVGPVPGFPPPPAGTSLTVTVDTHSPLTCAVPIIGKNLQKACGVSRFGSTVDPAVVTIHSHDATRLKFSLTPTGATSDTIQVTIPSGQSASPDFYANVFDSSGSVAYTVSSATYGSVDSTVVLAPSGLSVTAPGTMNVASPYATVTVSTARLDGTGSPVEFQPVASGVSIGVAVASDNSSVGDVTASPITIGSGSYNATTAFQAVGAGTARITASATGYGSGSTTITVLGDTRQPIVCDSPIGQFLQDLCSVILPVPAPYGGVHVTLQSNSPLLMLSPTTTGAGSATAGFDIPAGGIIGQFYVQSLGSSGSASFTATVAGYGTATGNVTMAPSGIVILGAGGPQATISVGVSDPPLVLTVYTAQLSALNEPVIPQSLAGGAPLIVSLINAPGIAGTVPATVTITPGTFSSSISFTPMAVGSTTVSPVQPPGWTLPAALTSLGIYVH